MKDIFRLRVTNRVVQSQCRLNIDIPKFNQDSFDNKSIRSFVPKTWNHLPPHIKPCKNLETFKRAIKTGIESFIKSWDGITSSHLICSRNIQKLF